MSEEERKAIGHLECLLDYGILSSEDEEPMKTVLNLIEKQQKEIEKKDKTINLMSLAILNYDDQLVINKYKDIEQVKETFKDILENETYNKQYFERKV